MAEQVLIQFRADKALKQEVAMEKRDDDAYLITGSKPEDKPQIMHRQYLRN